MSTYTVVRTNTATGAVYTNHGLSLREARRSVAWCCTDNLGMTRAQANRTAGQLTPDVALMAGHYTFDLSEETL